MLAASDWSPMGPGSLWLSLAHPAPRTPSHAPSAHWRPLQKLRCTCTHARVAPGHTTDSRDCPLIPTTPHRRLFGGPPPTSALISPTWWTNLLDPATVAALDPQVPSKSTATVTLLMQMQPRACACACMSCRSHACSRAAACCQHQSPCAVCLQQAGRQRKRPRLRARHWRLLPRCPRPHTHTRPAGRPRPHVRTSPRRSRSRRRALRRSCWRSKWQVRRTGSVCVPTLDCTTAACIKAWAAWPTRRVMPGDTHTHPASSPSAPLPTTPTVADMAGAIRTSLDLSEGADVSVSAITRAARHVSQAVSHVHSRGRGPASKPCYTKKSTAKLQPALPAALAGSRPTGRPPAGYHVRAPGCKSSPGPPAPPPPTDPFT